MLRAYGLTIESQFELAGLPAAHGQPDLSIERGRIAPDRHELPPIGVLARAARGAYLLSVPGTADFLVEHGSRVTVDPAPAPRDTDMRRCLLGPVMAAALCQREFLVLHAAAVLGPRGAVLIAGPSGHGKSTLAAALNERGYPLVTDEVAAIRVIGEVPVVETGPPDLVLWHDAAARSSGGLVAGCSDDDWQIRRARGASQAAPHPIAAVVLVELAHATRARVVSVPAIEAFQHLRQRATNMPLQQGLEMTVVAFHLSAQLTRRVPVFRLVRPRSIDSVDELVDHLTDHVL